MQDKKPMQDTELDANNPELLRNKLSLETALISWRELEVHYARGCVVQVDSSLDLAEVGLQLVQDNKIQVQDWMAQGQLGAVPTTVAASWHEQANQVWALVIAPWVLVQHRPVQ